MTSSIFSKLSQQSRHRDLFDAEGGENPVIGNPKTGNTVGQLESFGRSLLMTCNDCGCKGGVEVHAIEPDTQLRVLRFACPSCGSHKVGQDLVRPAEIPTTMFPRLPDGQIKPPAKPYMKKSLDLDDTDVPVVEDLLADPTLEEADMEDDEEGQEEAEEQPAVVRAKGKTA